jgi:cardiolipin synthase
MADKSIAAKDHIITVSNIITVSRLVLLPFIIHFLLRDQRLYAFLVLMASLLSDTLDGYLARTFNQESTIGTLLDPLCDKISLIAILVVLYIINSIPLWGVIIIITRDVLILIGSFVLWKVKSAVFKSNVFGKITGVLFGAIICAYTLDLKYLGIALLYLSIPAILVTFSIYLARYIKAMKGVNVA